MVAEKEQNLSLAADAEERLDRWLKRRLPGHSLAGLRAWILSGRVTVNGRPAKKGQILRPGDLVSVPADGASAAKPLADAAVPCRLIEEAPDFIVLEKPAGLHSVANAAGEPGTAASWLAARFPECLAAGATPLEAGLLHRLDNKTSGLLLAARNPASYARLRELFRQQMMTKRYAALVHGRLAGDGAIDAPLAHHPSDARRMVVVDGDGIPHRGKARAALTEFRVEERFAAATLIEVRLVSGVMHQIRAHFSAAGHPVVGEDLYRPGSEPPALQPPFRLGRYFLHATKLSFVPPGGNSQREFVSPLPPELAAYLADLRGARTGAR